MNLNGMNNLGEKMLPLEIERKFSIKYLPKEIKDIKRIQQKHIFKDDICSIRVRETIDIFTKDKQYTHTIKAKKDNLDKYSIIELEKNITDKEYENSKPFEGSQVIEKYRCIVPIENNLIAEVDIFTGKLEGVIVTEVEFESTFQAETFKIPEWFEKELDNKKFSNRKISTQSRDEVLKLIGEKQLNINKTIYTDFCKRILENM